VSFGGDACVIKLGRQGKKSCEGSIAMFLACTACGLAIFWQEPMCEYVRTRREEERGTTRCVLCAVCCVRLCAAVCGGVLCGTVC
jgi:hypothetical protein